MSESIISFWKRFDALRDAASEGNIPHANALLSELLREGADGAGNLDAARRDLLDLTVRTFGLEGGGTLEKNLSAPVCTMPEIELGHLPGIQPEGRPGVSLVTCCMNREQNLIRALASWVVCPEITEIVIVDWGSNRPVREVLREARMDDPRIRVVRVEDEPRWILSYAFNLGFRVASCEKILKADADIVLDPAFFARNPLRSAQFIAGNWRVVDQDQAHVNGFFYAHKRDLAAVAGFNEFITTYGWDDDDLYERLERHGLTRCDVDTGTIHHLPHSDEERVGEKQRRGDAGPSAWDELHGDTMHKIRSNRLLAYIMPYWHEGKILLPVEVLQGGRGDLRLRRAGGLPHAVPAHIRKDVDYYAALEMTSWRLGPRVLELERDRLEMLLGKPFSDLGRIDVEVALGSRPANVQAPGHYLVVQIAPETLPTTGASARAFDALARLARERGWILVLSGPYQQLPDSASERARGCSFVPDWQELGNLETREAGQLRAAGALTSHARLVWSQEAIATFGEPAPAAPTVSTRRAKIFIDGQHGLGNRMRAIGSAAAIAEKTDRELVIVWHPDAHCECRFSDLFDYKGAVIEEAFVDSAKELGCDVYNYMEVEPGAEKDAEIRLGDRDIYARSAYVLNNPHSSWEAENRFLRGLRPVQAVRDMVASVRTPNDVSAHVRMVGGTEYEHLAFEATDNWTEEGHMLTDYWRKKSHFRHFIKRLDTLIAEGRAGRIFLAADKPETYEEFKGCFGDRVAMLEREVYDRSAEQLRYALADVLLLGSAPLLLGSSWSSFSELAMRLSPRKMEIEMSGKDF